MERTVGVLLPTNMSVVVVVRHTGGEEGIEGIFIIRPEH